MILPCLRFTIKYDEKCICNELITGLMDFITGDSARARELRAKFIFKIVPMLNPDGVIVGNNRCSLTGRDLNRQYRTVIRETYPPVWHTKLMIRRWVIIKT